MPTPQLRPATVADIPSIAGLAGAVWRAHYPGIISDAQIEYMLARGYSTEALTMFIEGRRSGIDLAFVDGALAGFAAWLVTDEGRELKLDKLYVDSACQRSGIGGSLIAAALEHAREAGAGAVILNVNKKNTGALAAYRKHGFAVRDSVVVDIGNGFVMDDYVMQRTV